GNERMRASADYSEGVGKKWKNPGSPPAGSPHMGRQARADKRAHRHGVHAHDHDHVHSHAPVPTSGNQRSILLALVLTATFMAVEVAGGLIAGSLALIADAGHMLTDAAALALAWAGFHFGKRPSTARKTFGY